MDNLLNSENGHWQDLSDSNKYKHMFKIGYMVDCKFLVGPDDETAEIIQGHRLMFTMASPVFERMFFGEFAEAKETSEIRIYDAYPHDFKNFRYLIYNNRSDLKHLRVDETIAIHRLCDKYLVSSIAKQCILHLNFILIHSNSNIDETVQIFKFAFGLGDNSFLSTVKETLKSRELIPDYKLCDLSEDEFCEYIQIKVPESISPRIFSAVNFYLMQLSKLDDDNLNDLNLNDKKLSTGSMKKICKKHIILRKRLLNMINFNTMSVAEFISGPGTSSLLSEEAKFYILSMIVQKKNIVNNF